MTMKSDPLKVGFSLQVDAVRYLPEAEFGADLSAALAVTADGEPPFGQLILHGAGQPPIGLYDELLPLADGLAALLPDLRAGESVALGSYSQPDVLEFATEGAEVKVTDGDGDERRYPAVDLAEALAGCLKRLLRLLQGVANDDPEWAQKVARIKAG